MSTSASGTKVSKRVEKELHQKKVVIRRLPPDLTEEKFKELIDPFPEYDYFYFSPGDHTLGSLGCSRAYVEFENEEEIVPFRDQYDGMILESEKGGKYRAIIEFAPYQGVPKKAKRKPDARCGTIDKDPDFQVFMQSLENQPESRPAINLESYLEELEANKVQDVQVTPLIEYLRDRMSGRSGRNRGRLDVKKKRKGESSSGKSKSYKTSSKSGLAVDVSDTTKTSKSSSKGQAKEKKESESITRTGSSSKLGQEEGHSQVKSGGVSQRSSSESRQERKEKYCGSSDRKEGGGKETDTVGGEKESRPDKRRNRDRPDRSFYVPRGRDHSSGSGGGGERDAKDSSRDYYSRGGRSKQGRSDDSSDYGGRPRSRGRGRGYRRNSDQPYESSYQDK